MNPPKPFAEPSKPLLLSPFHHSQVSQSLARNNNLEEFLRDPSKLPVNQSQSISSESQLYQSRVFFQSQIYYLMKIVQKAIQLYNDREKEIEQMKREIKEYENKISMLQNQKTQAKVLNFTKGIEKRQKNKPTKSDTKTDSEKTRKKPPENQQKNINCQNQPIEDSISLLEFSCHTESQNNSSSLSQLRSSNHQNDLTSLKITNLHLEQKIKIQQEEMSELQKQLNESKRAFLICKQQIGEVLRQKGKLEIEFKMLKNLHQTILKQYNAVEEKYGTDLAEKNITIENLRELVRNIQKKKSPRKKYQKEQEGYYSINRILRNNKSQSSSSSISNKSFSEQKITYSEKILRQQNEFLRNQLIKAFDEKGAMLTQLNKCKKRLQKIKIQDQAKQIKTKIDDNNQNIQDKSNLNNQEKSNPNVFKKNKAATVLMVDKRQKRKKEVEQQQIQSLVAKLNNLIDIVSEEHVANNVELAKSKTEVLKNIIIKVKKFMLHYGQIQLLRYQAQKDIQIMKGRQTQALQTYNHKCDLILSFNSKVHKVTLDHQIYHTTDSAFKNVQLNSIPKHNISKDKEQEYLQKISGQQIELKMLRNRVFYLEKLGSVLQKLKIADNSFQRYPSLLQPYQQNENVDKTHFKAQQNIHQKYCFSISWFEILKKKLTQFYNNTIQELLRWQISTLTNVNSLQRGFHQANSQSNQSISNKVPMILQRNVLKISRQFKGINQQFEEEERNLSLYEEDKFKLNEENKQSFEQKNSSDNLQVFNQSFMNKKMSQSYASQQKNSETLQDLINKRLSNFQKFSTNWIQMVVSKLPLSQKKQSHETQKFQDITIRQQFKDCLDTERINFAMTERPAVERKKKFEVELKEVDARSESVASRQLMSERELLIREQVSYYVPTKDYQSRMILRHHQNKSYRSFKV